MAKSIFYINLVCTGEKKTIREISNQLVELLLLVGKIEKIFLSPILSDRKVKQEINISSDTKDENVNILANKILEYSKADIKKYEKEKNPTIDFSRDFGFRVLLQFFLENKERFSITAKLGSSDYQELKIEYFNPEFEYDFEWYNSILKSLVDYLKPVYGGVLISLSTFFNSFGELKVWPPLGWITYFSENYELEMPSDIKNIEYEYSEKGKYMILTRDDITENQETYANYQDILLEIMKQLKNRVPNYSEK